MLTLNAVTLRPFTEEDIDFLVRARTDLSIEAASQPTEPRPVTAALFRGRLATGVAAVSSGGNDDVEFIVTRAADPTGAALGIAGLYGVDRFNGTAEVGASIVEPSARGEGLGIDAYVALMHYGFRTLGLHKLFGYVKGNNAAARGTLRRIGLNEEGILREHRWIDGERVDLHMYGLLARDLRPELADWRQWDTRQSAA